jgi:hypothetical protein
MAKAVFNDDTIAAWDDNLRVGSRALTSVTGRFATRLWATSLPITRQD